MSEPLQRYRATAPAKINLVLSVHGKRPDDGFHDLTSLVAPLAFGDELSLVVDPSAAEDRLSCDDAELSCGPDNLILRALAAFRAAYPKAPCFSVDLIKRIPVGAGLGGGSSDAATAVKLANEACGHPLSDDDLRALVASIGSDCPLFIDAVPTVMEGRGERLSPLSAEAAAALRGRRVALFKPSFSIGTAWAYGALAEAQAYSSADYAQSCIQEVLTAESPAAMSRGLYNDFERIVCKKYLSLSLVLERLRMDYATPCLMSGSGSACFVFAAGDESFAPMRAIVEEAYGGMVFWVETSLA